MTKRQWVAVAAALGLGILAQIPLHNRTETPGHDHDIAAQQNERTAVLAVSGMT